jgi:hypothetical protein
MVDHSNEKALKNLSLFNVFTTPYKIVNSHAITADVLIPEDLETGQASPPSPYPRRRLGQYQPSLLQNVYLITEKEITGSSSYIGFFAAWIMEYAHSKSAIIVMPNYRLAPESKGLDILEDLADFWEVGR